MPSHVVVDLYPLLLLVDSYFHREVGEDNFEMVGESLGYALEHVLHMCGVGSDHCLVLDPRILTFHCDITVCNDDVDAGVREVSAQFTFRPFDLEGVPVHCDGDPIGYGDVAFDYPCNCHLYSSVYVR